MPRVHTRLHDLAPAARCAASIPSSALSARVHQGARHSPADATPSPRFPAPTSTSTHRAKASQDHPPPSGPPLRPPLTPTATARAARRARRSLRCGPRPPGGWDGSGGRGPGSTEIRVGPGSSPYWPRTEQLREWFERPVAFQAAQGLGQAPLGHTFEAALDVVETAGPVEEGRPSPSPGPPSAAFGRKRRW